jgi:hypothetical protein
MPTGFQTNGGQKMRVGSGQKTEEILPFPHLMLCLKNTAMTTKINFEKNNAEDHLFFLSILQQPVLSTEEQKLLREIYVRDSRSALLVLHFLKQKNHELLIPSALREAFLYSTSLNN